MIIYYLHFLSSLSTLSLHQASEEIVPRETNKLIYTNIHKNLIKFVSSSKLPKKEKINILTLKCLSIGTSRIINFPFVPNGKLMVFRCPNISLYPNS